VFISNPIEVWKIRMQMQASTGVRKRLAKVISEAGFRGMYVGLPATLLRDIPFNMLYFSSYAAFKKSLRDETGNVSPINVFLAGLGAGAMLLPWTLPRTPSRFASVIYLQIFLKNFFSLFQDPLAKRKRRISKCSGLFFANHSRRRSGSIVPRNGAASADHRAAVFNHFFVL
jgi:hypothetical protein